MVNSDSELITDLNDIETKINQEPTFVVNVSCNDMELDSET